MKYVHKNYDSLKLIIFFCGFYTDNNCFSRFETGEYDILYIFDYSTFETDIFDDFDFTPYSEINLIAYSYGVFASGYMKKYLPQIDRSCAISGTFIPIDDNYGMPNKVYDIVLNSLNRDTLADFEKKMFVNLDMEKSMRTIENLISEFKNMKKMSNLKSEFDFEKVILTKQDKIVPYINQVNFWAGHHNQIHLNSGHFPFYELDNLESALD